MFRDPTATIVRRNCPDRTADAADMVLMLAEHTGSNAPAIVRHALAALAASLGDPGHETIRAGLLGWDSDEGPSRDVIGWT
jgi:hypothetical protein